MSKIEDLIKQYCPDGVEWKKIRDVYVRLRGTPITAEKMKEIADENGDIRVFAGGKTVIDTFEKDIPDANVIRVPAVLVQSRGIIDFVYYDKPFTFKNEMWAYTHEDEVCVKYLYYVLKNHLRKFKNEASGMGSMPQISLGVTEDFIIPVPPRPVQDEIVRILDKFTELEKELEKELELRRKQYEFYRDKLLTFDGGGVEYKKLGELGTFYGGITGKSKVDFENGNAKFISYKNVYSNFVVDQSTFDRVMIKENENQRSLQYGDICFTGSSETPDECGFSSVVTSVPSEPLYLNSFSFFFRFHDLSGINPEYMKYLFRSSDLRYQIGKTANGVTRFNVSKELMKSVIIPIPSLTEQERIVKILDKFDILTTSLTSGIPAEIKLRKQQYEYYRDYLFGLLN